MTPREFREALKGHKLWMEVIDQRVAFAVSHIVTPHIKRGQARGLMRKMYDALTGRKEKQTAQDVIYMLDPQAKAQAVVDKVKRQREGP